MVGVMANEYLNFWNISGPVFNRPIHAREYFTPKSFVPLLERLLIHCEQGRQVALVTAPSGHGKSSLALWLYDKLPLQSHDALILALMQNESKPGWMMPRLASYFGIHARPEATGVQVSIRALERLEELSDEGRNLVLIIDASDHIESGDALEEMDLVLNLQSLTLPCVSFVILTTPTFRSVLQSSPRFGHRLGYVVDLPLLDWEETYSYLKHRLTNAQLPADDIVDWNVAHKIHYLSGGNFNRINSLMESTMIEAFLQRTSQLTIELVGSAAKGLPFVDISAYQPLPRPGVAQIQVAASQPQSAEQPSEATPVDSQTNLARRELRPRRATDRRRSESRGSLALVPLESLFCDDEPEGDKGAS